MCLLVYLPLIGQRRCSRYLPTVGKSSSPYPVCMLCRADGINRNTTRTMHDVKSCELTLSNFISTARPERLRIVEEFSVPTGIRDPDLAWPRQCGSSPYAAFAVTGSDHAKTNFNFYRYCGVAFQFIDCVATNWLSAAAAGAGVRSYFKVHFVETYPGPVFSGACQAFGTCHCMACGGYPVLDCGARRISGQKILNSEHAIV